MIQKTKISIGNSVSELYKKHEKLNLKFVLYSVMCEIKKISS